MAGTLVWSGEVSVSFWTLTATVCSSTGMTTCLTFTPAVTTSSTAWLGSGSGDEEDMWMSR